MQEQVSIGSANGLVAPKTPMPSDHPIVCGSLLVVDTQMTDGAQTTHFSVDVHQERDTQTASDTTETSHAGVGHGSSVTHSPNAYSSAQIAEIVLLSRHESDLLRARVRLDQQVLALCRSACGGGNDKAAQKAAKSLMSALDDAYEDDIRQQQGKKAKKRKEKNQAFDERLLIVMADHVWRFKPARDLLDHQAKDLADKLASAAERNLPFLAEFVTETRGLAWLSVGRLVGEIGDLANYATPSRVWKRMGTAPRNGKCGSTWRKTGGLTAKDWTEFGYVGRRRAVLWNVGECLMKQSPYWHTRYSDRKEYLVARETAAGKKVIESAKINAKNKDSSISKGHIHAMAKQYMEKQFLLALWKTWNRA